MPSLFPFPNDTQPMEFDPTEIRQSLAIRSGQVRLGRFSQPLVEWFLAIQRNMAGLSSVSIGTYAARPSATTVSAGSLYYASNQGVWYMSTGTAWVYMSGTMSGTLSPDQKPTLTTQDAGFEFYSTDFDHLYTWSGTVWQLASGEDEPGVVSTFAVAPTGIGWSLCNGAVVTRSTYAGLTTPLTKPDYTTAAYIKAGIALSIGPNAASGHTSSDSAGTPAGTISSDSAGTPAGTLSSVSAGTPAGSISSDSAGTPAGTNGNNTTSTATSVGGPAAGTGYAGDPHTHTFTGSAMSAHGHTFTGSALGTHTHTFTGSALAGHNHTFSGSALGTHNHGPGDLELANTVLLAYIRL